MSEALNSLDEVPRADAPTKYRDSFVPMPLPRSTFDEALLTLLAIRPRHGRDGKRDGRRAAMIAALDGKASWGNIRSWRRGNARAPQWAIDLLVRKMKERHAALDHVVRIMRES